jgi:hypothetical protein
MQRKDIKVGEEYAYVSWKGGNPQRVKVTSLDVTRKQSAGWRATKEVSAIEVQFLDGHRKGDRLKTTGRNIVHEWSVQAEINADKRARAQADAEFKTATAARRAAKARQIEDLLAAHGEETKPVLVSDYGKGAYSIPALKVVGFEFTTNPEDRFNRQYTRARFNVERFMDDGLLEEGIVTVLLADVAR